MNNLIDQFQIKNISCKKDRKRMKTETYTLMILLLLMCSQSTLCYDHFRFSRSINCQKQSPIGNCLHWYETTILYQYSHYIYYCFPGDLFVLTNDGPVQMKNLNLHHSVFSNNLKTGRNQFTPISAWLHHDPFSLLHYSQIEIKNSSWKFLGSKYHNIAFSNQNQTDFKFLKDLKKNDGLVTLSKQGADFRVQSVQKTVQKQGLYSPITETGTFYIFPDSFNITQYEMGNQYPMILAHSLSQIKNPMKNINIAQMFVRLSNAFFGAYQPEKDEEYVNSLLSSFNLIFGSDWVNEGGQKIAHRQQSYTYGSYSQTRNRRKQQRKRKTMVVLAVDNIMTDTLL